MFEGPIFERYYIRPMLFVGCGWIVAIIVMIGLFSSKDTDFFLFGPGTTSFLQFRIDTWGKWGLIMTYSFFSQMIHSLMNSTIYSFITNVIRDYKSPWEGSIIYGVVISIVYKLYYWIHDICDIFLVLTLQLQYWIPALIADISVSIWTTYNYLKNKEPDASLINSNSHVNSYTSMCH